MASDAIRQIALDGYEIVQYMPSVTWLIIGCGLLMFSLIMKMGITAANMSILKTGKAKAIRFSTLNAICTTEHSASPAVTTRVLYLRYFSNNFIYMMSR